MIVTAAISDLDMLTAIALKSKAFWGYSDNLIEGWREELTVTPKILDECTVYNYIQDQKIIGFYVLNRVNVRTSYLDFLFVLPTYTGKGIGSELLTHAIDFSSKGGCAILNVLSDPNAEAFYASHGFQTIHKKESSIPDRFLPEMVLEFPENM
ncbi:MAG: GNAT family N-acetyltransferase [Flavobacteriaceae bacterium]|nr:GNAT family N-acetyltransferase [Flavobacteriaceae bacterium]